ncbi:prolyl oligopeptidase family serine peptidase [bacterium]|nr:prolyl oligopeptidase family serine peptidase [bacterium]
MKNHGFRDAATVLSPLCLLIACLACLAGPAAAAEIPSIDSEIAVPGWWVIGPFPAGVREPGTDGLAYYDEPPLDNPLLQTSFPSLLVPGGLARWHYIPSGDDGTVTVDFPEITEESLELITDAWGFAGAMDKSYAFMSVDVPHGPRRALIDLERAGGFQLNGLPYGADPYGHHLGPTPVVLDQGPNEFKITISRGGSFQFRILPAEQDLLVLDNALTLPDLVRGEVPPRFFGLALVNTTDEWIELSGYDVTGGSAASLYGWAEHYPVRIAPLAVQSYAVKLWPAPDALAADFPDDKATLELQLNYGTGTQAVELELNVVDPAAARRVTFMSLIDDSVQYYGLLPPKDYDPGKQYGVIVSLHGAGVEAIGQARSYQPKDFAFVVAPTNRRCFGFDWQDWGRRDIFDVLFHLYATHLGQIDDNRVHLTGHSMGGHGTWYNAFTDPGVWASAAPSAGWTTFDLYVPMYLRRNATTGDPRANLIWQLALREDNTLVLADNALNLPIYALEGGADDNVPPQQPRMLVEELKRRGYEVEYEEVPGMGHWWGRPETPFTDCIDNERHNRLWRETVRDPWPRHVLFRTHNFSISHHAYWVWIEAPEQAYRDTVIDAQVTDDGDVVVKTTNVRALMLELSPELLPGGLARLTIDGQPFEILINRRAYLHFQFVDGRWQTGRYAPTGLHKSMTCYGPWREVMMAPFYIVYGTSGGAEKARINLNLARLYAQQWWYRGNGRCTIIPDTEFRRELDESNLILLGGPDCNTVTRWLVDRFPIQPVEGGVRVGGRLVAGDDLTYKFVYPQPYSIKGNVVLVEGGTSPEAMQRLASFTGVYSGGGFPDWMVWGDGVKLKGFAGAHAVGFFDMDWQVADDLTFWNEPLIDGLR